MEKSLQIRKRQLIRDAIYDAAIDLFAKKGFDETTIEEITDAAGISRRSFFRYFDSKDDLLALNTVNCGEVLCQVVASCPASLGPLEVVLETALAGLRFTAAQKCTRQIVEISLRSTSAGQAHLSRLMEVQDKVAAAFATRIKSKSRYSIQPTLLAGMSQLLVNAAIASWFMGEHEDMLVAAKHGFHSLKEIFSDAPAARLGVVARYARKAPAVGTPKKALLAKSPKHPPQLDEFSSRPDYIDIR